MQTFRVLTDESELEEFDDSRRTPRRVRFGGEIVKLRTPDSDSNQPSDTDGDVVVVLSGEIESITNKIETKRTKSLIPLPVKRGKKLGLEVKSLPSSPDRTGFEALSENVKNVSKSSPELHSKTSRIPLRKNKEKIVQKKETKARNLSLPPIKERGSPVPPHKEVEMMYNLTRNSRKSEMKMSSLKLDKFKENIQTSKNFEEDSSDSIPNKNTGDCLTCSSSGSDSSKNEPIVEKIGKLDKILIRDLQCKVSTYRFNNFPKKQFFVDVKFISILFR